MKRFIAIGLLLLLLYNMFGLTIAMLFFEENYRTSSNIIFDDKWKIIKIPTTEKNAHYREADEESLVRSGNDFYNIMHEYFENDTLYVILKSNQNAQERFSEITALIQGTNNHDSDLPQSPLAKIIKLLGDLQKIYLSDPLPLDLNRQVSEFNNHPFYTEPQKTYHQVIHLLHSPPPELT
ncbi:hypothetical protein [Emticicia soli]|uniref:Uncharacterized protein n=1 Tax=Emticicia soli TaxID=2027878 RepID=A0ABW5JBD0_9BACT